MPIIRPQDYYYLYSPWWSDPSEMFKYTIQALWAEGHIGITYRKVYTSASARYPRVRTFLKLGKEFDPQHRYTKAEHFILSKLTREEMRLSTFYFKVMPDIYHQIELFKTKYVFNSVNQNGWCWSRCFLNRSGRQTRKHMSDLMDEIDKSIDTLVKDPIQLQAKLQALGTNYIFLNENSLIKLNLKVYELREVMALFVPHKFHTETGISFGTNVGGGFGGVYSDSSGGGSFGGGGSGGD
jgi:uncharacterized membrane protein YgcG